MQEEKVILNSEEFALILNVSQITIKKLAKNGDIPFFIKTGSLFFIMTR
jgi:hypothetical protein